MAPIKLKITVFWDMTSCKLVDRYHCFWDNCCHHLQGRRARRASLVLASILVIMQSTLPAAYSYKASDQYIKKLSTKKGRL